VVYECYIEYVAEHHRWIQDRETIQTALDLNLPELVSPPLANLIQQLRNSIEEANGFLLVPPGYVGDGSELSFVDMLQLSSGLGSANSGQSAAQFEERQTLDTNRLCQHLRLTAEAWARASACLNEMDATTDSE
jgi:hypothetical protein